MQSLLPEVAGFLPASDLFVVDKVLKKSSSSSANLDEHQRSFVWLATAARVREWIEPAWVVELVNPRVAIIRCHPPKYSDATDAAMLQQLLALDGDAREAAAWVLRDFLDLRCAARETLLVAAHHPTSRRLFDASSSVVEERFTDSSSLPSGFTASAMKHLGVMPYRRSIEHLIPRASTAMTTAEGDSLDEALSALGYREVGGEVPVGEVRCLFRGRSNGCERSEVDAVHADEAAAKDEVMVRVIDDAFVLRTSELATVASEGDEGRHQTDVIVEVAPGLQRDVFDSLGDIEVRTAIMGAETVALGECLEEEPEVGNNNDHAILPPDLKLQCLDLSRCAQMTRVGFVPIHPVGQQQKSGTDDTNPALSGTLVAEIIFPEAAEVIGGELCFICNNLTSINVESLPKLHTIESYAFARCESLPVVTLPPSLKSLNFASFYSCTSLTYVNLSQCTRLTELSPSVFTNCSALKEVSVPPTIRCIGADCFNHCNALESVNGIEQCAELDAIQKSAFMFCTSLSRLNLPVRVREIGPMAFKACSQLRSLGPQLEDRMCRRDPPVMVGELWSDGTLLSLPTQEASDCVLM